MIEVVCGGMFSGKTEELMRRLRRAKYARQKVQVFKPLIDQRYSEDHVQSHDANRIPSISVQSSKEILDKVDDNTRFVGIDEAQFFDEGIVDVVQKLAYRGTRVVCAGLDMDFKGQPFGPMPKLLAVAEQVTKLSAVCVVCGQPATRSQRLVQSTEEDVSATDGKTIEHDQVLVGATEFYEARCRICHEPRAIVVGQVGLFSKHAEPTVSEKLIAAKKIKDSMGG